MSALKQILWKYCPPLFYLGRYIRRTRHQARERRLAAQLPPLREALIAKVGFIVQEGPFKGMNYKPQTSDYSASFLPRLIGAYEVQTHAAIQNALSRSPAVVVDIGCEEGYCAVGLARRHSRWQTYAFDIDEGS